MKRITLPLLFAATIATQVAAQDPVRPTPPARPAPAGTPVPAPAPRAAPAHPVPPADWDYHFDYDFRLNQMDVERMAREAARISTDVQRLDLDRIREQALEASRMNLDAVRINADAIREAYRDWTPMAPMAPMPAMPVIPRVEIPPMAPMALAWGQENFRTPPAPWAQGDPADSLYRVARNALTNGDYGRAARLFADLSKTYPKSVYADDSPYWEATARYRIGTTDELHNGAKLLEPMVAKIPEGTTARDNNRASSFCYNGRCRTSDNDVAALYARVLGVLAQRGDRDSQTRLESFRKKLGGSLCDQEYSAVQSEALSTLAQMDWKSAQTPLKSVLERRDDCSVQLRRNAVYMIGRRTDAESGTMLISVAKSDPSTDVRTSAIEMLARVPGDGGFTALEDILRSDQDERIQKAAVRALTQSDNQRARTSMRALIDRKDAPLSLRIEAINSFNSERATTDDGAYLRGLYTRAESDQLKRAIIDAVGRMGGKENDAWIISIATNANESSSIRSQAMSRLSRANISVADIGKLYDGADSRNMRTQLINVLRSRKEPEAADKLVDIVKNSTDYQIRMQALNAIQARNDPRAAELINSILDGTKKP